MLSGVQKACGFVLIKAYQSVMWTSICIVSSAVWEGQAKRRLCRSMEKFLRTSMPVFII